MFFIILGLLLDSCSINMQEHKDEVEVQEIVKTNGASWSISHYLMTILDIYGFPFLQDCVTIAYIIYTQCTCYNMLKFALEYVPMCICMYKYIQYIYRRSRERLRQKQMELEDIQLQIQIVTTKLCVRDADFKERTEHLQRERERLRRVRSRIRELIATDDGIRRSLDSAEIDLHLHATEQEDNEFIMELLKDMKCDRFAISQRNSGIMDCGERESDIAPDQSTLYSSLSDMDMRQDCKVKIIKVTNVYKVAYLKHYIKQKRLRRECKRAALKKKMESIKLLLEEWHNTLSKVVNHSKLTIINIDAHPMDVASQEAMGDYSKPQECSDSDSDLRNDMFYEDRNLNWTQSSCPYIFSYEDGPEPVSGDYYEQNNGDVKHSPQCNYTCFTMTSIVEETGSQLAIEEVTADPADECRDLIAI